MRGGNLKRVKELVSRRSNVNEWEGEGSLLMVAIREGYSDIALVLLAAGADIRMKDGKGRTALHWSCWKGLGNVVQDLVDRGSRVEETVETSGITPLMYAACQGHEEVVKKLILSGANPGMQDRYHDTALHFAAIYNHIQCGIFLAEAGASVRTKNTQSNSPFDLASVDFKAAIQQALSFTTRKTICIIGNAAGGKSTLIAALQAENNTFLGKMVNRFKKVSDHRRRTAGIETIHHCSKRYGDVLFFDFAGQHEYHGPHQMFLESLLTKPGVSVTLLLVVKVTEEEETISHQLHRWLTPVVLMAPAATPPQVIIIGSFLDKVTSKQEAAAKLTTCIEAARNDLGGDLPIVFLGSCLLDCRQPQSEGINQLCSYLHEIPIPEFGIAHSNYSVAWVLSQTRLSFKAQAVQLQDFTAWIEGNMDNLPKAMPSPEEVCRDLSATGHALYLRKGEDVSKSWLVLDLPGILHYVYGTLFSHSKEIVNEIGLLHCQHLERLFPQLDVTMIQQLLVSLEFCIPVDPSLMKVEVSKLTRSKEASGWLFFPALISAKSPPLISEGTPQQTLFCWQLRTSKRHSISARVLQTILLRLSAHFVVRHHLAEGVLQHCCSIWWNGIAWQSRKGIDVTIHITNNRVIQVVGASKASADKTCQYLTDIVSDILSTVKQLSPKLVADAYILHPPIAADLYRSIRAPLIEEILHSVGDFEEFALSMKDASGWSTSVPVSVLFCGWTPPLQLIRRMSLQHCPSTGLLPTPTGAAINPPPRPTSAIVSTVPPTPTALTTNPPLTPATASADPPSTPASATPDPPSAPTAVSIDPPPIPAIVSKEPLQKFAAAGVSFSAPPSLKGERVSCGVMSKRD